MIELHVVFRVGEADYVVPARDVVLMESFTTATPVPGAPPWVCGLVQVRGEVLPVIDLRLRFGLEPAEPTLDTRLVVVREGTRKVGLKVDAAREVKRLDGDTFHDPPDELRQAARHFVRAIASDGDRLLLLLDPSRVVGREDLHGDEADHG